MKLEEIRKLTSGVKKPIFRTQHGVFVAAWSEYDDPQFLGLYSPVGWRFDLPPTHHVLLGDDYVYDDVEPVRPDELRFTGKFYKD